MNKAPEAFRTISEVADELDLPQHVLRFWESRFPHIKPMKRGGGRRYYRREDVELLRGIRRLLYADGYTIRGVQRILREQGVRMVQSAGQGQVVDLPPPSRDDAETSGVESSPPLAAASRPPLPQAGEDDRVAAAVARATGVAAAQVGADSADMASEAPAPRAESRGSDGAIDPAPKLTSSEVDRLKTALAVLEACRRLLDGKGRM